MSSYVFKPRPPRLLAVAALFILVAGILFGVGWGAGSHRLGLWVAAVVVLLAGAGLVGLSLALLRRRRVQVDLDANGYTITGPEGERTGSWGDVTRVALSRHQDKLALYHGERRRTIIAHPAGAGDDDFRRLRHELDRYLETTLPQATRRPTE